MVKVKDSAPEEVVDSSIPKVEPESEVKEESKVEEVKKEEPKRTIHVLHGTKVYCTDEEKAKVDQLAQELNDLLGDRLVTEVSLKDPYYTKKQELDSYIGN